MDSSLNKNAMQQLVSRTVSTLRNRYLLLGFFANARTNLAQDGVVELILSEKYYKDWGIENMAESFGFKPLQGSGETFHMNFIHVKTQESQEVRNKNKKVRKFSFRDTLHPELGNAEDIKAQLLGVEAEEVRDLITPAMAKPQDPAAQEGGKIILSRIESLKPRSEWREGLRREDGVVPPAAHAFILDPLHERFQPKD
jgi:hypothetical protein